MCDWLCTLSPLEEVRQVEGLIPTRGNDIFHVFFLFPRSGKEVTFGAELAT